MVPEGWIETRLGTSAQVNPRTKRPSVEQVSFLAMADVSETAQVIQYDTRQLQKVQSGFTIFSRDDVIVAKITPCFENGKGAYLTEMPSDVGYGSTEFHVIRAKAGETDAGYLNLLVNSVPFRERGARNMQGSAGQRRVPVDFIKAYPLHLPPLPEQRKIADILSTWDQAIDKTEALLSNARTQKRALMQQLLTGKRRFPAYEGQPWKEVRIRDLVNLSPKMDVCPYDRRLTFLTMDAVTEEAMIAKPIEGNWDTHVKGFTQFKDGDILVAKITPCFENGKGCHASNLINGIGTGSTEFHVLRPKDVRDARFIFHVTNSYEFRGRGALNMQGSAGQRRVPTDFIRAYPLTVPENPDARQRIGSLLDDASNEIQHHHLQITKLRTEKKALMQQLLTGKRRVVV
jgi:type I restriction enzyme S subunit